MNTIDLHINHRYLYGTIIFVVIVSLFPVAIIGIITNYSMVKAMNTELILANERILKLTANAVETLVFQTQNNCRILKTDKIFTEMKNMRHDYNWYEAKKVFSSQAELEEMYEYLMIKRKIFERLESEKIGNAYIDSVYCIDYGMEVIFTSNHELLGIDSFYEGELLKKLDNQIGSLVILDRIATDKGGARKSVLTFVNGSRFQGDSQIVIINLRSKDFHEYLNKNIYGRSKDHFAIINNNRVIISESDQESTFTPMLLPLDLESLDKDIPFSKTISLSEGSFYLTGVFSDSLYWWFLSLTSTSDLMKSSHYLTKIILTVSIIMVFILIVVISFWSLNWYRPIRNIMTDIMNNLHVDQGKQTLPKGDIGFIEYGIKSLYIERDQLEVAVKRLYPYYLEKYILGLLRGSILNHDLIQSPPGNYPLPIQSEDIAVVLLQIESNTEPADVTIQGSMAKLVYGIEISKATIMTYLEHFLIVSDEFDRLILIVNIARNNLSMLFEMASRLQKQLSGAFHSQCNIGISHVHDSLDNLPEAFEEAQQALSHSVFFNEYGIVYIEDIMIPSQSKKNYGFHVPPLIFTAIRAGKEEEALQQLTSYLNTMAMVEGATTKTWVNDIIFYFIHKLFDLADELSLKDASLDTMLFRINEELIHKNEIAALDQIRAFIKKICTIYRLEIESKNSDHISLCKHIVDEQFSSSMISLSSVAQQVNLNPDYLGRIFKEAIGFSFVEYITNIRIRKSIDLLKTSSMKIKDIATAIGYNNTNYYIKIFKARIGMTPKDFKERH